MIQCPGYQPAQRSKKAARFRIIEWDQGGSHQRGSCPHGCPQRRHTSTNQHGNQCPKQQRAPMAVDELKPPCRSDTQTYGDQMTPEHESVTFSSTSTSTPPSEHSSDNDFSSSWPTDDDSKQQDITTICTTVAPSPSVRLSHRLAGSEFGLLDQILFNCYINDVSPVMSASHSGVNPFARDMCLYGAESMAVLYTLLSSAAVYLQYRDQMPAMRDYAWHCRNLALKHLRHELKSRSLKSSTLAGVIMLAITEVCYMHSFDVVTNVLDSPGLIRPQTDGHTSRPEKNCSKCIRSPADMCRPFLKML